MSSCQRRSGNSSRFFDEAEIRIFAKLATVARALTQMWGLVARDRWVIFAAFSVLIVATLSEISIPHYLTTLIFIEKAAKSRCSVKMCGIWRVPRLKRPPPSSCPDCLPSCRNRLVEASLSTCRGCGN
ncbi:hypothetical protein ACFX2J_007286 [Malus domestica]